MLKPFPAEIEDLAFVYAHSGRLEDDGNRIYSISAEIVRPKEYRSKFDSLVRYAKFTERERYYSNLTKKELESAPKANEVKRRIQDFLKNQKFVFAFNVNSNFPNLSSFIGIDRIVDLNFAAEFFLQSLESHSLKRLWEYLFNKQRNRISFSSREIIALSMEFVRHICSTALNDRGQKRARVLRYYLEKSNTLFGKAFVQIARNYRGYFGGLFEAATMTDTGNWESYLEQVPAVRLFEDQNQPYKKISDREIADRFRQIANAGKGYKLRTSQLEYARSITSALNESKILCIEAGTGTGKTRGYLIPCLEFLRLNANQRIAISTYTKSLQSQIVQKEIGFLKKFFKIYEDIPIALLKGKSSYVCAEKLSDFLGEEPKGAQLLAWLYLANNVYHYETADVDTIGENVKNYLNQNGSLTQTLAFVSAKDGCDGGHRKCPAQVVTEQARNARLIVTNHHKLALLDQEPLLQDLFQNYIIDEANHFESAIRNAFKTEADSQEIGSSLQYIRERMQTLAPKSAGASETRISTLLETIEKLTDKLYALRQALISINPKTKIREENILDPGSANFESAGIKEKLGSMRQSCCFLVEQIQSLLEKNTKLQLKIVDRSARKLESESHLLQKFSGALALIEESLALQNVVPSYRLLPKNFILAAAPVEVGDIVREHICSEKDCVVYTAATLCENRRFEGFHEILGLDRPVSSEIDPKIIKKVENVVIPSPFAPDLMEILVPKDAIDGGFNNKKAWLENIRKQLPELIIANKGRTLVLFSSYDDLQTTVPLIADEIVEAGYPVLVQEPGSPTINLCDEFRIVKESVLFGVDSFWYGVDFPGDTLTQVIVTRIPFPSINAPIQKAKRRTLTPEKFSERYYYQKSIKLKQGIGRLIRSENDRGKVVILDTRFRYSDYPVHQLFEQKYKVKPANDFENKKYETTEDEPLFKKVAERMNHGAKK